VAQKQKQRVVLKKTAKMLAQIYADIEVALIVDETLPSERRQSGRGVGRVIPEK